MIIKQRSTRLILTLSLVLLVIAYPTLYLYGIKYANDSANVLITFCEATKPLYPNDLDYMNRCREERNQIYETATSGMVFEIAMLSIALWLIFIFFATFLLKLINWIKRGD